MYRHTWEALKQGGAEVAALTRLAGTFWPFVSAGRKKKMMLALFESLSGYRGGDFSRLAALGRRMGDDKIAKICRSLAPDLVSESTDG